MCQTIGAGVCLSNDVTLAIVDWHMLLTNFFSIVFKNIVLISYRRFHINNCEIFHLFFRKGKFLIV